MASRNIFLPKELNRRIPNGTYGGVRGMNNLYSIAFPAGEGRLYGFPFAPWGGFDGFIIRGAFVISQAPSFPI